MKTIETLTNEHIIEPVMGGARKKTKAQKRSGMQGLWPHTESLGNHAFIGWYLHIDL